MFHSSKCTIMYINILNSLALTFWVILQKIFFVKIHWSNIPSFQLHHSPLPSFPLHHCPIPSFPLHHSPIPSVPLHHSILFHHCPTNFVNDQFGHSITLFFTQTLLYFIFRELRGTQIFTYFSQICSQIVHKAEHWMWYAWWHNKNLGWNLFAPSKMQISISQVFCPSTYDHHSHQLLWPFHLGSSLPNFLPCLSWEEQHFPEFTHWNGFSSLSRMIHPE